MTTATAPHLTAVPTEPTPPTVGTWGPDATWRLGIQAMTDWACADHVYRHVAMAIAQADDAEDRGELHLVAEATLRRLWSAVQGRTPDQLARRLLAAHATQHAFDQAADAAVARWLGIPRP